MTGLRPALGSAFSILVLASTALPVLRNAPPLQPRDRRSGRRLAARP